MSVAESMVILAPIVQVGWASASVGVATAMASCDQSRKGPPEAVRMSRETLPGSSPTRHCQMAECSESMGRSQASGEASADSRIVRPDGRGPRPGQGHDEVAGADEHLLVGGGHDLAGLQRSQDRAAG